MTLLLLLCVNLLTCAGQLLQKQAVVSWHGQSLTLAKKLRSPWLLASVGALVFGMLIWLRVLQQMPISVAYPMLSLNFVLVTLASSYWFKEATDHYHWIGIALIISGITLLGGVI